MTRLNNQSDCETHDASGTCLDRAADLVSVTVLYARELKAIASVLLTEYFVWNCSIVDALTSNYLPFSTDACLRCQAESKQDARYGRQDCVVVWGECNHSFHYCCMSLWVKQNNRCPLCQQEWSIQRMGKWTVVVWRSVTISGEFLNSGLFISIHTD